MSDADDGWMPRLAEGVPIWKLVRDLNQPDLMDGGLIAPETEGSPSAPRAVRWHVRNLLSLDAARKSHPLDVEKAIETFRVATIRSERALESATSPYHTFRKAFTLPNLSGEHYFFDPSACTLHVIHWGAEPRSHGVRGETVYGFGSLSDAFQRAEEPKVAAASAADDAAGAGMATPRPPKMSRRAWRWALALIALPIAGALFFMRKPRAIPNVIVDAAVTVLASATASPVTTAGSPRLGRETLLPFDKPLLFEFGSARIDAQGDATMKRTAAYLAEHPEIVRVRIEGHADATGEDDKNFVLSTARALAVQRGLVAAGVDRDRLTIDAHGQSKPSIPDASAPAMVAQNRRVELWIVRNETSELERKP